MNYRRYGDDDLQNYLKCFLLKVSGTDAKQPPRKKRNLKTFDPNKTTVHQQKKKIKDQNTVISCLRKKIAFSKYTNKPVQDLDQFLRLPRAICDADGMPEKGQKSSAATVFKNTYSDAFVSQVPPNLSPLHTCFIIDGMFIINTSPLPVHKSFADYAEFLFSRWILKPQKQFQAYEIHLILITPTGTVLAQKM